MRGSLRLSLLALALGCSLGLPPRLPPCRPLTRRSAQTAQTGDQALYGDVLALLGTCLAEELSGAASAASPARLLDNAHLLSRGRLYELGVQELLNGCASVRETKALERVDAAMRGFVLSERKARSRLKLNYVMAGAASGRVDAAIELLAERCELPPAPLLLYAL